MTRTFEAFWAEHGAPTVMFNNLFLEPMAAAGKLVLIAQQGSDGSSDSPEQRIANAVLENFEDPRRITNALVDTRAARKLVTELSGHAWTRQLLRGALRTGSGQFRRVFGPRPTYSGLLPHAS
jgi:hypothetical protein